MKFTNNHRKINVRTVSKTCSVGELLIRNGTVVEYESGYLVDGDALFSSYSATEISKFIRTECKTGLYSISFKYNSYWTISKVIHTATKKEAWEACKFADWFYNCKTGKAYRKTHR